MNKCGKVAVVINILKLKCTSVGNIQGSGSEGAAVVFFERIGSFQLGVKDTLRSLMHCSLHALVSNTKKNNICPKAFIIYLLDQENYPTTMLPFNDR